MLKKQERWKRLLVAVDVCSLVAWLMAQHEIAELERLREDLDGQRAA